MPAPLIEFEKVKKKLTWEAYQVSWADENHNENCYQWAHAVAITKNTKWQLSFIAIHASLNVLEDQNELENGIMSSAWCVKKLSSMKECGITFLKKKKHVTNHCDLIYNPLPCMIYIILEEEKPISSCALELKSTFNSNLNSDKDDNENNSSSSIPNEPENYDDSNSNSNPKIYITLSNLTKKQELKWFSDNNEGIMPEHAHNTDAGFDLRYLGKDLIKLKPYLCTCINLKIALEILTTTMVQLISRSSLAKKRINIKGGIIDTEYIENIIAMLRKGIYHKSKQKDSTGNIFAFG
ncbi:hypothetical protein G9A89_003468 [Geosiphon pyriformis]|nr:hypothetical protein G9A89_003468 [Geosiphon pyriformis]